MVKWLCREKKLGLGVNMKTYQCYYCTFEFTAVNDGDAFEAQSDHYRSDHKNTVHYPPREIVSDRA